MMRFLLGLLALATVARAAGDIPLCDALGTFIATTGDAPAAMSCVSTATYVSTTVTTSSTSSSTSTSSSSSTSSSTSTSTSSTTSTSMAPGGAFSRAIGGTASDDTDVVAVSADGTIVVGGVFRGTVTIGSTTLTPAGLGDWYLAKYTAGGSVVWAQSYGGTADDGIVGVAIDSDGNILATGFFNGTGTFGGAALTSAGGSDIVLAKFSGATGAGIWSKRFGDTSGDQGLGVAVDASKNVYLTGYYRQNVNFGGATLDSPLSTDLNVFVAKYNAAGTHQWSKRFWNSGNDRATGIATDGTGVVIGGYFNASISFDGTTSSPGAILDAGTTYFDGFAARLLATDGSFVWQRQFGAATDNDYVYTVAIAPSGDVLVGGTFLSASVDVGGGALTGFGKNDAFVAQYSSTNTHEWSKRFGSSQQDNGFAVAADASNNVYLGGSYRDVANFSGGVTLTTDFSLDTGFIAKCNASGTIVYARSLGGTANSATDQVRGVATTGGVALGVGFFNGTATFGGANPLTSAGNSDGFVARLDP